MNTTQNQSEPSPYPQLPQFTGSERPVTRADRIAFTVWCIMFLLTIAFTLVQYLVGWLAPKS